MSDKPVSGIYQQQITLHTAALDKLTKRGILFGWLRFASIVLIFTSIWLLWANSIFLLILVPLVFLSFFLFVLSGDLGNKSAINNLQRLIAINRIEIAVLQHRFTDLPAGDQYKPSTHEYANDLDIFGRASLYQYINRTNSEQGNKLLAGWLLDPAPATIILQRQEAVKELVPDLAWRQQLQSCGKDSLITIAVQQRVENWLEQPIQFINKKIWKALLVILPAISFILLGIHIAGIISPATFYPLLFLQLVISLGISKKIMPAYVQLNKAASQLESLSGCIGWIEQKKFNSILLQHKNKDQQTGNATASKKINKLKKILDLLDIRLNPLVFLPLNAFLFWDLQQVFALEKWKTGNKEDVSNWFNEVGEMEALSSLATLSFNHPGWCFPVITGDKAVVDGEKIGHPLIPAEKLVYNSFSTGGLSTMNIVTGSNMAGKSTFLRSIGVNLVLAMTGAPVCASAFRVSHMKVMSSMRVSDNLEESTSTFYAELKKLKEVIEAVYAGQDVFLLLDEILRGTNSADRHTGSEALIKQLIQHNAAGMIATHDLALAKLADAFPAQIHNYHFDVQVADDELYFDYQLKRGVCTSMNASILMKKIGIEL
ncbi:MAG TPA: hypothetical protein VGO58_12810 [Chitinophagaceae bacterium]|jgi:hypothetical protein|nr:hypothetical protein [Chitinophagaceae bacterium]